MSDKFEQWLDEHSEIVVMQADEIAEKAWNAGLASANQQIAELKEQMKRNVHAAMKGARAGYAEVIDRQKLEIAELKGALRVALKYLSGGNGMASEDVAAVVNAALHTTDEGTQPRQSREAPVE